MPKKVKLTLENLKIKSFVTTKTAQMKGGNIPDPDNPPTPVIFCVTAQLDCNTGIDEICLTFDVECLFTQNLNCPTRRC